MKTIAFNSENYQSLNLNDFSIILFFSSSSEVLQHVNGFFKQRYPAILRFGCTTAGEICDYGLCQESLSGIAFKFEKSEVKIFSSSITSGDDGFYSGKELAIKAQNQKDLKHLFVLSDGIVVNGSRLVQGLKNNIPENVSITGGLAGDNGDFKKTLVIDEEGNPKSETVSILCFYGDIQFGWGSFAGWDSFGVDRLVTKAKGNILYEIDGKPALDLYKSYLGAESENLPASGLLFPLSMKYSHEKSAVIRTILGINEAEKSLIFAGEIHQGAYVRLMKANVNRLISGAEKAAKHSLKFNNHQHAAILISCIGRKLVLKQLIDEEIDAVKTILNPGCMITGFYSYGEIAPDIEFNTCELHNQTMTITTLFE